MGTKSCIRVLIADNHPIVRYGLTFLIESQPDLQVIGAATNGRDAVELYQCHQPDITLLDLRMQEMDGITVITAIRQLNTHAGIVVFTSLDDEEDIACALRAGAQAYLLKCASVEELLDTIRSVYAGHTHIPPFIADKLAKHMHEAALTRKEQEVLRQLVTGKTNKQIGEALFISTSTAKAHVSHLLQKLDAVDRTQAVSIALKRGLVRIE